MSLDIEPVCPTCNTCPSHEYDLNITHNVRGICVAAGVDPWEWHGVRCGDCVDDLRRAVVKIRDDGDSMRHLEPSNGWGSVAGTSRFLRALLDAAEACPAMTWKVSR